MKDLTETYEDKTYATREEAVDEIKRVVEQLDDPEDPWFSGRLNYVVVSTADGRFIPAVVPKSYKLKHSFTL